MNLRVSKVLFRHQDLRFELTTQYVLLPLPVHLFTFPGGTNENLGVSFSWGMALFEIHFFCVMFCGAMQSMHWVTLCLKGVDGDYLVQSNVSPFSTAVTSLSPCDLFDSQPKKVCSQGLWISPALAFSDDADLSLTKNMWSTKSSCSLRAISNVSTWSFPTNGPQGEYCW